MRKIAVMAFMSLDGVMQAPGGPSEDGESGFKYGGWIVPHFDDELGANIGKNFEGPFDLLLGRKTYDIFEAHWPVVAKDPEAAGVGPEEGELGRSFDRVTKYVATHRPESLKWKNSKSLGADPVARLKEIKKEKGPTLLTQGSSQLLHLLFANELVDEIRLYIFPIALGLGKRVFNTTDLGLSFKMIKSSITAKGVVCVNYERKGVIDLGSFELPKN